MTVAGLVMTHLLGANGNRPVDSIHPLLEAGLVMARLRWLRPASWALMATGLAIVRVLCERPAWRGPASSRLVAANLAMAHLLGVSGDRPVEGVTPPLEAGLAKAHLLWRTANGLAIVRLLCSGGYRPSDGPLPLVVAGLAMACLLEDGGRWPGYERYRHDHRTSQEGGHQALQ